MCPRIFVLFCVIVFNSIISCSELKLQRVFVTYRSQAHTACDFPSGPNITNKNESTSRLTEEGKNAAYKFGEDLKNNYSSLLGITTITNDHFNSMATRTPRTQQSALIVAAGLLKNETGKTLNWTKEEGDKTIFNKTDNYVKFYNKTQCPKFFEALTTQVTEVIKKTNNYTHLVKEVAKNYSGLSIENPTKTWLAYETFASMKDESKLPEGINDTIMAAFKKISEQFIFTIESNETIERLSGGVMVDSLLTGIENSKYNRTIKEEVKPNKEEKSQETKSEVGKQNEQAPKTRKKREMSLLAVPQGVLAAMIGAFSPNGTKYGKKKEDFTPETFYPQDGSYLIAEYYANDNHTERKVRILYSPGGGHEAMPLIYPNCKNGGKDENDKDDSKKDSSKQVTENSEDCDNNNDNNNKNKCGMCTLQELKEALEKVRLPIWRQDHECTGIYELMDLVHEIKDIVTTLFKGFMETFDLGGASFLPIVSGR